MFRTHTPHISQDDRIFHPKLEKLDLPRGDASMSGADYLQYTSRLNYETRDLRVASYPKTTLIGLHPANRGTEV